VDEHALVGRARLQQADAHRRVFAQTPCQHAAGRATPYNDVIKHACRPLATLVGGPVTTLLEAAGKCRYDSQVCFTLKRVHYMDIKTVGIIGAGTMGNGIAQACAVSGINVVMVDISDAAVQKGLATVSGSLDRLIKKEKITQADKDTALARIKTSTSYADLKAAQLVIEAATENYELTLKILNQVYG